MARHSAEERAASFYRATRKPIEPPKGLCARARKIWREITDAKPVDWFDDSQAGLLADHCEIQVLLEDVRAELRRVPVGSPESASLINQIKAIRGNFATSAKMLRLSVQWSIGHAATKAGEHGGPSMGDQLIGGRKLRAVK